MFDYDFIPFLKGASILLAGLFSALGLFSDFWDKNKNRITKIGMLAVSGISGSLIVSVTLLILETEKQKIDSATAERHAIEMMTALEKNIDNAERNLRRQETVLKNISRIQKLIKISSDKQSNLMIELENIRDNQSGTMGVLGDITEVNHRLATPLEVKSATVQIYSRGQDSVFRPYFDRAEKSGAIPEAPSCPWDFKFEPDIETEYEVIRFLQNPEIHITLYAFDRDRVIDDEADFFSPDLKINMKMDVEKDVRCHGKEVGAARRFDVPAIVEIQKDNMISTRDFDPSNLFMRISPPVWNYVAGITLHMDRGRSVGWPYFRKTEMRVPTFRALID